MMFPAVEFTGASVISCSGIKRYYVIFPAVETTCASDISCSRIYKCK
jgi:hypothetical protein